MTAPIETETVKERMQQGIVQGWNRRNPIGTPVRYWPGVIMGPGVESVTRSEAWVMPSGHAVAKVEGYAGGIALTHIVPRGEAAPKRIQRSRAKGWRMPSGAKYVGRGSKWGNPYRAIRGTMYGPSRPIEGGELVAYSTHGPASGAVVAAVEAYERDIDCSIRSMLTTEMIRQELRGKDLACWCPLVDADGNRVPCHADVLLEIAAGGES